MRYVTFALFFKSGLSMRDVFNIKNSIFGKHESPFMPKVK